MDFDFFRRSSTELCEAILHPNKTGAETMLQQYLVRIDDARLERALAALSKSSNRSTPSGGQRLTVQYGEDCLCAMMHSRIVLRRNRRYGFSSSGTTRLSTDACCCHLGPGPLKRCRSVFLSGLYQEIETSAARRCCDGNTRQISGQARSPPLIAKSPVERPSKQIVE